MWERRRREEIEQETRPPRQLRSKPARLRTCAAPNARSTFKRIYLPPIATPLDRTKYITRHQRAREPASANRTRVALLVQLARSEFNYSGTIPRSHTTTSRTSLDPIQLIPHRDSIYLLDALAEHHPKGKSTSLGSYVVRAEARPYRAATGNAPSRFERLPRPSFSSHSTSLQAAATMSK